jgi:hypothetical protein
VEVKWRCGSIIKEGLLMLVDDDRTICVLLVIMIVLLDDDPPFFENRVVDRGVRTTQNAATVPLQRILVGARDDATIIIITTTVVRERDQTIMLVLTRYGRGVCFVGGGKKKWDGGIETRRVGTSGIRAM